MWNESSEHPSVLIVEGDNGDVFIVESKESKPQVDKILKTEKSPRSSRRRQEVKVETVEPTPGPFK